MDIGLILSILGLLLSIALALGFKFEVFDVDVFKKRPAKEVFDLILNKKTTDPERKKLLKKLNKYDFFNKQIKKEYIQAFSLGKRGPEDLLLDICVCNNIEPTDYISKSVLDYISSNLKTRYSEKIQSVKEETTQTTMKPTEIKKPEVIESNPSGEQIVFLSELLKKKHPDTCDKLISILNKHKVKYSFLKATKDIWCRDYMPVQTPSGKLIQFKYDPSYLKGKKEWEDSRSDVEEVCRMNDIDTETSDINLDGGNVLICDRRAILSDRIYSENPDIPRDELRRKLAKLLECEIIVIPSLNKTVDFTGHADGMVRFVKRDKVLGIKYDDKYKKDWWKNTQKILENNNISFVEVPFFEDEPDPENPDSAIGVYVNYLEVNDLIVLPVFGREEDKQVKRILQEQFPNKTIEEINYNEIAKKGGLLNCTSWVLKK
jgi:agmatine/peptidylarginine deiminase